MIKLLFLLISVFSSFAYGKQDYNLIMYQLDYNYSIIGDTSNYLLVNENCYKMIGVNDYEYKFTGLQYGKIKEANNQIYVFGLKNNKLIVNIFTKYGIFLEEKILVNNEVFNYKIKFINNNIYIFGNINNYIDDNLNLEAKNKGLAKSDIVIFQFDLDFNEVNHNLLGGKLNESITDVEVCDQVIYIIGKKDQETGGDLGYGGLDSNSIFIAKLDDNLEFENYIVLDKKFNVENFFSYNSNLYLSTNTNLYSFSKKLIFLDNLKYPEIVKYSHLTEDSELIGLSQTKGYVYDINKMEVIDFFSYPDGFDFGEINFFEELDNSVLCEYDDYLVLLDIVKMKDSHISDIYTKDKEIIDVSTIFGKCTLIRKEEEYYFDPLVCGKYPFSYFMETRDGLEFSFTNTQLIPLETNVIENGVYPIGYNLRFTGKAYLNDEIVINNYPLNIVGNYKLVLLDNNNTEKVIKFSVSEYQRQICDFYQDYYQYEINKGEDLELNIVVENIEDDFVGLYVNEKLYDISSVKKEENLIAIKVNDFKNLGYHCFYVEKLIYKRNEVLYEDKIDKYFYVKVNPVLPIFELEIDEENSLIIGVEDADNCLRLIRLYLYNNNFEYYFDYPIHNNSIIINNVNIDQIYNFNMKIGYYTGSEIKYSEEIIAGKIHLKESELIFGNINLLNNYETINKFSIKINDSIINNELEQLSYLNTNIFLKNDFSYMPVIIFSIVVGSIILGIVLLVRKKKLN